MECRVRSAGNQQLRVLYESCRCIRRWNKSATAVVVRQSIMIALATAARPLGIIADDRRKSRFTRPYYFTVRLIADISKSDHVTTILYASLVSGLPYSVVMVTA